MHLKTVHIVLGQSQNTVRANPSFAPFLPPPEAKGNQQHGSNWRNTHQEERHPLGGWNWSPSQANLPGESHSSVKTTPGCSKWPRVSLSLYSSSLPDCVKPGPGHEGRKHWGQGGSSSDPRHNPRPCLSSSWGKWPLSSLAWRTHPSHSCGPCSRCLQLCFALVSALSPCSLVSHPCQLWPDRSRCLSTEPCTKALTVSSVGVPH